MSIKLNAEEQLLREEIAERMVVAQKAFKEDRVDDALDELIFEAGGRAHRLHMLLKAHGEEPRHHGYMVKNRGFPPDHPDF